MPSFLHRLNLQVDNWSSSNAQLQCAIWEPNCKQWLLSQALPPDGAHNDEEDTRIHCYDTKGKKLWTQRLKLFGHGSVIGARLSNEGNLRVWVPCDSYDDHGNTTRTRIARVLGQSGTYDRHDDHIQVYDNDDLGKSLSPFSVGPYPHMFVRYGKSDEEVYYLTDEDTIKAGDCSYTEKWRASKSGRPGPFQGCAARHDSKDLYVLSGSTNEDNRIEHYRDGVLKAKHTIKISDLKSALKGCVTTTSSIEPEGLTFYGDQLVIGARCGPTGNDRCFALLDVDL